jgi:acyl-CoA thioester hydrolase
MTTQPDVSATRLRSAYEGQKAQPLDPAAAIPAPLELHRCHVKPEWVDYNAHMSESCYLLAFGDSSDAFFLYLGIDDDYRARGYSIYVLETHMRHVREVSVGEPLRIALHLVDADHQRLHLFQQMFHGTSGALLATVEQLMTHVDMRASRSAPFPAEQLNRVAAIRAAHAAAPRPDGIGRTIAIRRRTERRDDVR